MFITLVAISLLAIPRLGPAASWEQVHPEQVEAFEKGDLPAVKRIVTTDKEFNNRYQMRQALLYATNPGNLELIKYLQTLGWLEVCRKTDLTPPCYPLHMLAGKRSKSDMEMLSFFIANGFEINVFNDIHRTPLQMAGLNANFEVLKFLCEHGADPNLTYRPSRGSNYPTALETVEGNLNAAKQYDTPKVIRYRAKLTKIVDYLQSGQCQKK